MGKSSAGANVCSSPSTNFSKIGFKSYRESVTFDSWIYGERITDVQLGTPDEWWYRIVVTTKKWIPSALIFGNTPGSTPLPPSFPGSGSTIGIPVD